MSFFPRTINVFIEEPLDMVKVRFMNQQVTLSVERDLIDAIDALVAEGMFKSRSEAIKAALLGFIRTKNAERVKELFEQAIDDVISDYRRK